MALRRRGAGGLTLSALLIIIGLVLFLIPEPGTSMLGIVLIVIGVLLWLL